MEMRAKKDLCDRTKQFALQVICLFTALPKTTEAQVIEKQVLRSGTSVGANYREAYRGRSRAEFIAKTGNGLIGTLHPLRTLLFDFTRSG